MTEQQYEVHIQEHVRAPRTQVWRAFTQARTFAEWYAPAGWSIDSASLEIDAREGGLYRVCVQKIGDPAESSTVTARFTKVTPGVLLASRETIFGPSGSDSMELTLTVELADSPDGTTVSIHEGPFPYGVDALAQARWEASLARLASFLHNH
jgi:uncharacterized protein YndB with AHSA1/START domain